MRVLQKRKIRIRARNIRPRGSIWIIRMVAKDVNRNVPYPKVINLKNTAFFKFNF